MDRYALVVPGVKNSEVDRTFHYRLPKELEGRVFVGSRVLIPFGKGNRRQEGYVVGFSDETDVQPGRLKDIIAPLEDFPVFTPAILRLAFWMRDKYYTTLANCLRCVMPSGIALKNDFAALVIEGAEAGRLRGAKRELFEYIKANAPVSQRELVENFTGSGTRLRELARDGYIEIKDISGIPNLIQRVRTAYINEEMEDLEDVTAALARDNPKQHAVAELLLRNGQTAVGDIRLTLGISDSPIRTLEKKGILIIKNTEIRRDIPMNRTDALPIVPTPEQRAAICRLLELFHNGERKPVLIHGVTGSGKTEIYMRLIEECIRSGRQAIMLVPEISLTPQAAEAFAARFGDAVTVTHSRLSQGERYDQWKKARDGQVDVMIGPRSAIFTPFENLGIIIIDEEHERTYTSETSPKYSIGEVAAELSRITDCMVVLGSATPSVATYHSAQTGAMELLTLRERVNKMPPEVEITDMRLELAEGNRSIFSRALYTAMTENLDRGEQTILFLNRRGHSTFVSCRACGYVLQCEGCNVNYTYHIHTRRLICHYCGRTERTPEICPVCGSKHIRYFGTGTQKVEEEVKTAFPAARVLRMDMDTTARKHSHERIIGQFAGGGADILIGTQMVAKGLNFPHVSLVGIIAADIALNMGDFRSAETAYQLITQVSGRAGRAEIGGRVFVQTYNPEHYSVICARNNDYHGFYSHEIAVRERMAYPPFTHIFLALFTGTDERQIIKTLNGLLSIMTHYNKKGFFEMLGPAPCVLSKLRGKYRWKLLAKGVDEELLKAFVLHCVKKLPDYCATDGISINLTLNPAVMP